jgi:hypothetical protein
MPHNKAAAVLGSYLGVRNLEPASVLNLDVEQITGGSACTCRLLGGKGIRGCWQRSICMGGGP